MQSNHVTQNHVLSSTKGPVITGKSTQSFLSRAWLSLQGLEKLTKVQSTKVSGLAVGRIRLPTYVLRLSQRTHSSQKSKDLGDRYFKKTDLCFIKNQSAAATYFDFELIVSISYHRKKWPKTGLRTSQNGHVNKQH